VPGDCASPIAPKIAIIAGHRKYIPSLALRGPGSKCKGEAVRKE